MLDIAAQLVPDFLLILLGAALYRGMRWPQDFWNGIEKLVYFILFPALLFNATSRTHFEILATALLLKTALLTVGLGVFLGWLALPVLKPDGRDFASGMQCAFRFNSYVALALAGRLGGEAAIAFIAVIIGFAVPICNAVSVYMLSRHSGGSLWRELARNPLISATAAGLLCNLVGLRLPEVATHTLERLSQASIALGLITVGAGLRLAALKGMGLFGLWITVVKLLALPLAAWLWGRWVDLPPLQAMVAVLFAALPTASSAYILAVRMGGNGPLVAAMTTASTLGSMLTLPAWIVLVMG